MEKKLTKTTNLDVSSEQLRHEFSGVNQRKRLNIGFILAPNFTLLAFSGIVDTLRLAADEFDRSRQINCSWSILSHDMRPIRSSCGVSILPTSELIDPVCFDYIVVVGGVMDGQDLHVKLKTYLQQANGWAVPLVSVCTGCFVLANLGLLRDYRCCVSWFHAAEFGHRFPEIDATSEELFVIDRDRISCAGGVSVIHLAAHLVEKYCGPTAARKALRIMIETKQLPAVTLQPQPLFGANSRDLRVRKALLLMERTLSNPVSTDFIARHVGLSKRQLERLFRTEIQQTPADFFLAMRLNKAQDMLRICKESITGIALECGFTNRSHFAATFRTKYGFSPSLARERMQTIPTGERAVNELLAA